VNGDLLDDSKEGWPGAPASPAVAAFIDLMTGAMEVVMVIQLITRPSAASSQPAAVTPGTWIPREEQAWTANW